MELAAATPEPDSPSAHQQGVALTLRATTGLALQERQQQQETEDKECAEQEECADILQDYDLLQEQVQDTAQEQDHADGPCSSSTPAVLPGLHSQVVFYRTSVKLSEQQVSLPRGIYTLPAGEHLPVQLYVAVHAQGWDSDQYVAQRAASLAHLSTQDSLCQAASPSAAPNTTARPAGATGAAAEAADAAVAAAPGSTPATDGGNSEAAAAGDAGGSVSPQQGSCSPPSRLNPSTNASSSPGHVVPQHKHPLTCASRQGSHCSVDGDPDCTQGRLSPAAAAPGDASAAAGGSFGVLHEEGPAASPSAAGLAVLAAAAHTASELQQEQEGAAVSPSATGLAALAAAAVTASELQTAEHLLQHSPNPEPEQQRQHTLEALAAGAQQLLWSADALESWAQGFGEGSQLLGPFPAVAKAQCGPREGMARISRVQHGGRLKGIWHSSSYKAVLYEKVGVTLLVHLKPHTPSSDPPATSRQRKRKPAKLYSLPGEGYGHQIYPGSVTEVELNAKLCCTASGTIPLKLPKALVLSQFSAIASLPHVVPLDLIVDGVPAELTMQVQTGPTGSNSSIRVQREVKISQLPRHQAYCLAGLATAGLGAYVGHTVTRLAAPGAGGRIIMHLASPAAMAAAAAAGGGWPGPAEDAGTAERAEFTQAEAEGAAVAAAGCGSRSEEGGCAGTAAAAGSNDSTSTAVVAALPAQQQNREQQPQSVDLAAPQLLQNCFPTPPLTPAAAAAARRAAAAACLSGLQAPAMLSHRSFWLQRLSRSHHRLTPAADQRAAAAAAADGSDSCADSAETAAAVTAGVAHGSTGSDADAAGRIKNAGTSAATAECTAPAAQAAVLSSVAAAPVPAAAAAPAAATSRAAAASRSSSRLDMFRAILQRQQQQQQAQKHQQQALMEMQQQAPMEVQQHQQQQEASRGPVLTPKLATTAGAAAAMSEDTTHPAACSTPNCSSGSSDFTSCGLSSGAAAAAGGGAPQADTPTSAHAAAASNAGAFAAAAAAGMDAAANGAAIAAPAVAVSRKRGSAQRSRLGQGGINSSSTQQQQHGADRPWGGADALVAVVRSKRQKRR